MPAAIEPYIKNQATTKRKRTYKNKEGRPKEKKHLSSHLSDLSVSL